MLGRFMDLIDEITAYHREDARVVLFIGAFTLLVASFLAYDTLANDPPDIATPDEIYQELGIPTQTPEELQRELDDLLNDIMVEDPATAPARGAN